MKNRILLPVAVLSALLAAGCRNNESTTINDTAPDSSSGTRSSTTTGSTGGTVSTMSGADKEFVIKAGQGGIAEVSMGRMAMEKASHADVKAFGQRLVTDHGMANQELATLATIKGLALGTEPGKEQKEAAEHLSKVSADDFDRMFVKHMVEDHDADVKAFENASRTAQDADLRAFAAKTLPTLQDHLRQIREIQSKLK